MFAERDLTEVTFKDVYERAGIPPGSAYHFFDNIEALALSLIERIHNELLDHVSGSMDPERIATWVEMTDILIDRVIAFYNGNPAARRILTHPRINMGTITDVDTKSGIRLETIFDRYFVLPEMKDRTQVFILSGKVGHLFISISASQYGMIIDEMRTEIKASVKGYLKMHLPEILVKRS